MSLRYLIPAALLIALVVLLAAGLHRDPRQVPSPLIGKPAPSFSLAVLGAPDAAHYGSDALNGRPVLVNFFASWCAACEVEQPFLMQLAAQGVEIIGIDYKDSDADAQRWLTRHGNPYRTVVTDPHGAVGLDWGVYGAPETYLLNADGVIVYKQIGPMDERVWRTRIVPLMKVQR